jgi:hypothetical protein
MAANDKDTIYIDIDDEITGIIDKLKISKGKVVALVLPKRAAVFQSIVNMKLLKRAADSSGKNVVLITSEAGLLPLAGAAGVHVAKTLTSRPEIPTAPKELADDEEAIDEDSGATVDETPDPSKSVGELAGATTAADGVETVMLDDESVAPEAAGAAAPAAAKTFEPPAKKDKKLKIPDFDRFRLLLALGGLALILLIVFFVFAIKVLPKATISIKTDATSLNTNLGLSLSPTAKKLDQSNNTLPAKLAQQQKTYTQQVPTTGQKNNGNKASGSVTVTNCTGADYNIPAGTGFSSGGNTYISQESASVPDSTYKKNGDCNNTGKASISVLAQAGGSSYNKPAGASFTIANNPGDLSAQGGTMSGGTDNIVQTVNQNDINSAKSKIATSDSDIKHTLSSQLSKDGYYTIEATFSPGTPAVTSSANVGDVANNVTVTETVTYTEFGVHKDDLRTLVINSIKDQIDTNKQSILNDGVDQANYNVDNLSAAGGQLTMTTTAAVGPDLDVNTIRESAVGKKPGAVKSDLQNDPDVTSVDVKLSPFWVSTVPKKTSKITVNIAKPTPSTKTDTNANNP